MRKHAGKLIVLAAILAVTAVLEMKFDLFPVTAESNGSHSTSLKQLENAMAGQFQERNERFTLYYSGNKEDLNGSLQGTIRSSLAQDDYTAYILDSYLYTVRSHGDNSVVKMEARYRETPEQTAEVDRLITEALGQLITPGMNDHQKVKVIHDWIVDRLEYDQTLSHYTAYEALATGYAVCQGYSLLGYKMLKQSGINVRIAEGTVKTGDHAWNMVELDGKWYHLDLTWDDPIAADNAKTSGKEKRSYRYYLKTDDELRADHQWVKVYPPAQTSYADELTLLAESGEADSSHYAELKKQLGLHWLEDKHTVRDGEKLFRLLRTELSKQTPELQFRYLKGEKLADDLQKAVEKTGIPAGYSASYEPYASDGSVLVTLKLKYVP
ncbi:transglutaminase domain-containing protein [Paenibacillus sp. NPDC058071]|uniref:transglutaminase domain-containing protein n=1 Tax=Paenibacillus sp. NPDC058071 TaxID=3346326 RepID=UPI0036D94A82